MPDNAAASVHLERHARAGFISDLHLSPSRPDIEARLHRYLTEAAGNIDVLFILGDLFEFWIGDDAAALCGHDGAEAALAGFFRDTGCRGYIMHGNRDFLIGKDFCARVGCELLADPCVLDIGGARLLLSHGDAYCTDDIEHQHFRAMVHDPAWQHDFLRRDAHDRLAYAIEARSKSESGKSSKPLEIMDVNDHAVESAMEEYGVHLMIHGHTHRPAVHRHRIDGTRAHRVVLGDWFDQLSSLTIAEGAIRYELGEEVHAVRLR